MLRLLFENKKGGAMSYGGYAYGNKIRISEDGNNLEIYNPKDEEVMLSLDAKDLQSIEIKNTIRESTIEWLESFIRSHESVYEYWKEEIDAAWLIHDLITHNETDVPCECETYRRYGQ